MATPEEIAAAKEGLTSDQLKFLGNADPTDPFIRARGGLPPLNSQVTIPSASDINTADKYDNADSVIPTSPDDLFLGYEDYAEELGATDTRLTGVPRGAEPQSAPAPSIIFKDINGKKMGRDTRVKLRVPANYLIGKTAKLSNLGGVIFPYTPAINYEYKADYATQTPLHTNFAINFYQRSSISAISIAGKFSVSNANDANFYIASLHLLRSLTKMRFGGSTGDQDSGAPPPVCRLDAYGDYMLQNVPVVITSVRVDLPDGVDYFTLHDPADNSMNSVPAVSTIAITCLPMFSRNEMQKFNVNGYMTGNNFRKEGYM
jgi:hypothetical protein